MSITDEWASQFRAIISIDSRLGNADESSWSEEKVLGKNQFPPQSKSLDTYSSLPAGEADQSLPEQKCHAFPPGYESVETSMLNVRAENFIDCIEVSRMTSRCWHLGQMINGCCVRKSGRFPEHIVLIVEVRIIDRSNVVILSLRKTKGGDDHL